MTEKLTDRSALQPLLSNDWELDEERDAISKRFVFEDFVEAFGWMTSVAIAAEKMKHHPEWFNVYRTVKVNLTTHDCSGLSALDVQLAQTMDQMAG